MKKLKPIYIHSTVDHYDPEQVLDVLIEITAKINEIIAVLNRPTFTKPDPSTKEEVETIK